MIGFDIGGTKCSVSVGKETPDGLCIERKSVLATDCSLSPYRMLDKMYALAREMTDDISVIGISCGGPLDSDRGVILSPPNLPGWDDVRITEYLEEKYGAKSAIQNDANACAVAEWKYGAGRGAKNMIFLTFGTGLGAGLILNGKLYTGANDMAGEVGHIRLSRQGPVGYGKEGSFEGFCSGGGLAALGRLLAEEQLKQGRTVSYCRNRGELSQITAKRIAECALQGDEDARQVYRICGERLGQGLSILIDILNPERIVLGSIFQRSESLLRDEMQRVVDREALLRSREVCRILPAALGDDLGDYAALSVASMVEEDKK